MLRVVTHEDPRYEELLVALGSRGTSDLERVEPTVRAVLREVQLEGDAAVIRHIERFESRKPPSPLFSTHFNGEEALAELNGSVREALCLSAHRIRAFHEQQAGLMQTIEASSEGVKLVTRTQPLERVGVYAPGGKALYPSSVLMSAIPAKVAGVPVIIVASPNPGPELRAACHLAGVSGLLDCGGAQAIAALAFGTNSIPRVDKIVGPGNIYVAAAKRLVFGRVSIDSIAGPSEILVLADESANPEWVAADLLSQAEHDEAAYALLACTSAALASEVGRALQAQLQSLPRKQIAEASLLSNGVAWVVPRTSGLVTIANRLAIEHLAIHTRDAELLAAGVRHAGAIFMGSMTPEAAGDYLAGPSHVLPTGGAARFSSPLGVYDFVSRTSLIGYSAQELRRQAPQITTLARAEGLEAHARAVEIRVSTSGCSPAES